MNRDESNRMIGAAVGIIMMQRRVSYAEGFGFLQRLSRQTGRTLPDLARDVAATSEALAQDRTAGKDLDGGHSWASATARLNAERSIDDLIAGRLLDLLVDRREANDVLHEMTQLTVDIVPGCEWASITVIHDGAAATVAASDACARSLDQAQYAGGEGPCLQAARTDRMVQLDELADDPPEERAWRTAAREAGVTASLSMPIPVGYEVLASANLYSLQPSGWAPQSRKAAQALAIYTGDAIALALRYSDPGDLLPPERYAVRGTPDPPWSAPHPLEPSTERKTY